MRLIAAVLLFAISTSAQVPAAANAYRARLTREARLVWGLHAPVSTYAAQIQQESAWNPRAHSGVGAQGIAQFMPATAKWIATVYPKQLGGAAPLDPAWALRALVYYDHRLYSQLPSFRDSTSRWAATLSAYNGGLGWVFKDERLSPCGMMWFGCIDQVNDGRSAANLKQNRDYPRRILFLYRPRYDQAGW